jgi:hypothetical protein
MSDDRNIDVQRAGHRTGLNIISLVLSCAYYLQKFKMPCHSKNCDVTYCCRNTGLASYLGSPTPEACARNYPDSNLLCFYTLPLESAKTSPHSKPEPIIFVSKRHTDCIIFKITAWMTFWKLCEWTEMISVKSRQIHSLKDLIQSPCIYPSPSDLLITWPL